MTTQSGIQFPVDSNGKASTTRTGKQIFSAAIGSTNHELSVGLLGESNWRKNYMDYIPKVIETAAYSEIQAESIAERGLKASYSQFEFLRSGKTYRLQQAMEKFSVGLFFTAEIKGELQSDRLIQVEHKGASLQGQSLHKQINNWIENGIIEADHGYDVLNMVDDESARNLTGKTFVLLGAGSEVGPLQTLLLLGATVIAVARNKPENWKKLIATAKGSSGTLIIPCKHNPLNLSDNEVAEIAGADLLTQTPEIAYWINSFNQSLTLGSYAYLDGAKHVQVVMAMDAIAQYLLARRNDISLSYLLTPSDVYCIPRSIAKHAHNRFNTKSIFGFTKRFVRSISMSTLFSPSVGGEIKDDNGRRFAVLDNLVNQQGPNYVLAKHIQRWRAIDSSKKNIKVSCNVAPASSTQSVVSNQFFAAAIWGSESFGVEVFSPNTVNTLMTMQLLSDLNSKQVQPRGEALFITGANHGGAWRIGYCFRSLLLPSLLVGFSQKLSIGKGFNKLFKSKKRAVSLT